MLPIFFSTHWLNPHHLSVSGWLSPPQLKTLKKSIGETETEFVAFGAISFKPEVP
jgi:hypothetical protein